MKQSPAKRRPTTRRATPLRLLTAVPICDGHDSAINTINLELVRAGMEVVYLGYHRSVRDIVRAAIQEDVRAIGLSSYNGGHVEFFTDVVRGLRKAGAGDIAVFGGGGGTITPDDVKVMHRNGVDRIFFPGTPLEEMIGYIARTYANARPASGKRNGADGGRITRSDLTLARTLTAAEDGALSRIAHGRAAHGNNGSAKNRPLVLGVTGPGGAGKTTLIDELVLRFLNDNSTTRIAILSHDPSIVSKGALLGDRATMVYSQNDRVFMRSLASRGQGGGLSPATTKCLHALREFEGNAAGHGFDVILVETVGIGQEAMPFGRGLVDRVVLVMSPDYGARLQLQKIAMLDAADVVVVNKSDQAGARTASSEIEQRLSMNGRGQKLITTTAKRHRDAGVDELFALLRTT